MLYAYFVTSLDILNWVVTLLIRQMCIVMDTLRGLLVVGYRRWAREMNLLLLQKAGVWHTNLKELLSLMSS